MKKRTVVILLACLAAAGVAVFLVIRKPKPLTPKQPETTTITEQNGVQVTTSKDTTNEGTKTTGNTPSQVNNTAPEAPKGTFVSNHKPNLDGDPAPNQLNSVCQTSVGATCEIHFTSGSTVKILGPNKVGSDGFVNWDWKLADIGLTQGVWHIEAIARNGDKSLSATDPTALEVGP